MSDLLGRPESVFLIQTRLLHLLEYLQSILIDNFQ